MVNILFCGNDKVFDGILTCSLSILKRTLSSEPFTFYVFTMDVSDIKDSYLPVSDEQIRFFEELVQKYGKENRVIKIDVTDLYNQEFRNCPNESAYCSPYTLIRLLADLVEGLPDKLLYLDVDVLFQRDIHLLYDTDISSYEYAAARDHYGKYLISPNYINAGVLLFNMKEMRKTEILKKARELLRKKKLVFADQSALIRSTTRKKMLPQKFNDQKFLHKHTVVRHFSKRLFYLPYPHTDNIKQWQISRVHKVFRYYEFDDILYDYVYLKKTFEKDKNKTVPIFYACDENFTKFTVVSLKSMIENASKEYHYRIYILNSGISDKTKKEVYALQNENFEITFADVTDYLRTIASKLPLRDYYSKTTYFRLFIAEMYPEYDKVIYIDSDTIVKGDISELYFTDIGDSYVGACHELVMVNMDVFGTYAEQVVGVSRYNFFNAGVLLINTSAFRIHFVLDKFIQYLNTYNFVVTQDEDYLNLICKDHVFWLDQKWNTEVFRDDPTPIEKAGVLHYIMMNKPWHYEDCPHGDLFWKYAKMTSVYPQVKKVLASYTDKERERDTVSSANLVELAKKEIAKPDNFMKLMNQTKRSKDRVEILDKIERYERERRFDEDVENDPPTKTLMPNDIDYYRKSFNEKLQTKLAFIVARKFVAHLLETKKMIIKDIKGLEYFRELESGAVVTCNHFNAFDSFAIQMAYEASEQHGRTFYRVIREGNYTSFPGFYGFLMRHCNTLPLSSNRHTLKKFTEAINNLLKDGNFILIYPEQSMWWNYRKPKPLKPGGFMFASKSNVPVLPCFITMKDTDILGEDGFFVQEYTIHIAPPIYPKAEFNYRQNTEYMMKENEKCWKEIYEKEYQIPLEYLPEEPRTDSQ